MIKGVRKWVSALLSMDDRRVCPVRVIGISGAGALITGALSIAFSKHTFDSLSFGGGIAAIVGAVGAGARLKDQNQKDN